MVTDEWTTTHVTIVEQLAPTDAYDLVLVIMRKNHALEILPVLATNVHTPNVVFLMNNAAGPGEFTEALGTERVLVGFPSSAGYFEGYVVHTLAGTEENEIGILFGEVDGRVTERTKDVAQILGSAPGYHAEVRMDMDAWLKCHVALLMPGLAPALYMCKTDNFRMARTRDAIVLTIRAIREGLQVMRARGIPITPNNLKRFEWIPEPLLVFFFRQRLTSELFETAMVGHANAARSEVQHLTDEFLALARQTNVPIPAIERLYPYLDPDTPPMPDGSAQIPMKWGGMLLTLGAFLGLIAFIRRLFRK
jgi:2-dehydropantoate 2-reductase